MGGASQGNQGVAFGARRQITSAAPNVPSLAEKERKRREQEAEEQRMRQQAEEAEVRRGVERHAEEERERAAEERRWEEESRKQRVEEKRRVEDQKREWEEQERRWKADEEARQEEEREALQGLQYGKTRDRAGSDARLQGQFLSQYQAEQKGRSRQSSYNDPVRQAERERVADLERQLEEAKERERRYEQEREERTRQDENRSQPSKTRSRSRSRPPPASARGPSPEPPASDVSWAGDEREFLRNQWQRNQHGGSSRPLPNPTAAAPSPSLPSLPSRPLPEPTAAAAPASPPQPTSPRPLPDPSDYATFPNANPPSNRTDRFLSHNPAPTAPQPSTHFPSELGLTSTSERAAEDARRTASQQKTKAGGWASKSLLEREMERERERQREWEEAQKEAKSKPRDESQGVGPGQSWDVNQYGFTGGDSQNRGGGGIGFGGRRQIIGPRPKP